MVEPVGLVENEKSSFARGGYPDLGAAGNAWGVRRKDTLSASGRGKRMRFRRVAVCPHHCFPVGRTPFGEAAMGMPKRPIRVCNARTNDSYQ